MLPKAIAPAKLRHDIFGLSGVSNGAKARGHRFNARKLLGFSEVDWVACNDERKLSLVLISKLSGLLYPIPRAVDDADAVLGAVFEVFLGDHLLPEGAEHDPLEMFLLVLKSHEQLEPLHLFTSTLLAIALFEANHEEWDCFIRLLDLLPFTFPLLSYFQLVFLSLKWPQLILQHLSPLTIRID